MLERWLGPMPLETFQSDHLHSRAHAGSKTAASEASHFGWKELGKLLASGQSLDALVVAKGQTIPMPPPRELIEMRGLLRSGIGLVIRQAESLHPALAALARNLTRDVPGRAHVQVFVTPEDSHSFGWHYDFEEVFILQTEGVKDYFFRANTVDPEASLGEQPDFELVRGETSPLMTARLLPGDWLYLPARFWHAARCTEPSLSLSVGILTAVTSSEF